MRTRARILVVDDDVESARLLASYLSAEHDVLVANDGAEGLAIADSACPDLIVADVSMPGMDGFAMVRTLRTMPRTLHTPVIFVTARGEPRDVIAGINAGARHYVTKPIRLEELGAKIRSTLPH